MEVSYRGQVRTYWPGQRSYSGCSNESLFPADNCLENLLLRSDIGDCEDGKSMNVTFNDLTPGSTAVYQCCSGYMLIGNDATQLTCQPDGNWDRTPPVCVEIPPMCPSCPECGCPECKFVLSKHRNNNNFFKVLRPLAH